MNLKPLVVFPLATALPLAVHGQQNEAPDEGAPKNWEGEAELGVLITSGNTEESNIKSRLALKHEVETWRNTGEFRSGYSEAEDVTTSEKYRLELESDYKFVDRQYWFVRGFYEDDRFSGFDYQSSLTTGYGNRLWESGERSFLDLSIGAGYRFNKLEVPDQDGDRDQDEAIARFAGQYDQALSDTALFRQALSVEQGLDNSATTTESETSVQANIVGSLSMKAAYRVQHLSDPPAGAEKTDTEVSVTLLYGF
jgi:putative salt-induced outer membrane protein YdiY